MIENIRQRYEAIANSIAAACARSGRTAESVRLIAVTKTHPPEVVQAVIDAGIRDIGENKVQELEAKAPRLRGDFELHMIGHLQTNKVAKAVNLADWIESVDSARVLEKIVRRCEQTGKRINVLIQVNTSAEQAKSGCAPDEALSLCETAAQASTVDFRGLMTIGPLEGDEKQIRDSFALLRRTADRCAGMTSSPLELSMGMSGDFEWAIEEGATMIRIGSLLVGSRSYQ